MSTSQNPSKKAPARKVAWEAETVYIVFDANGKAERRAWTTEKFAHDFAGYMSLDVPDRAPFIALPMAPMIEVKERRRARK